MRQKKAIIGFILPVLLVMILCYGLNLFSQEMQEDTINIAKVEYEPGEDISIDYRCSEGNLPYLWIGIFKAGMAEQMMKDAGISIKLLGDLNASVLLNAPDIPGAYQVRLFSMQSDEVIIHQLLDIAVRPPNGDTKHPAPKGLTVYLGGAGMDGEYIIDQIRVFRGKPYLMNVEAGKFTFGTIGDVAILLRYLDRHKTSDLPPIKELKKAVLPVIKKLWERRNDSLTSYVKIPSGRYEVDWSLKEIGVRQSMPSRGQFNLIGYSFGSLIAAQSAIYYADKGKTVNHLVLIGSPISKSFLEELKNHKNIGKVIIRNLKQYGDPIYAGMPKSELTENFDTITKLITQFVSCDGEETGKGHFYYAPGDKRGQTRRAELAADIYKEGLR
jgi:hypothetical protein